MKNDCEEKQLWSEHGAIVSGHKFVEIENNSNVQILKCEVCGFESIGYKNDK